MAGAGAGAGTGAGVPAVLVVSEEPEVSKVFRVLDVFEVPETITDDRLRATD